MTKEDNSLTHIAIIMDGNGRWATKRGLPRSMGHKKGAETVKEITRAAGELGVKYLTLYAFSTENWQRSPDEVETLMGLLRQYLKSDLQELQKNNVRIRFIGERDMLAPDITAAMAKLEADTAGNDGLTLCVALSYGSRQEIVSAVKKAAALVKKAICRRRILTPKCFPKCSIPRRCRILIWLFAPAANSASATICYGRLLTASCSLPKRYGLISIKMS